VAGHQEATRELWPNLLKVYDTYVSALVYEEAARGDIEQASSRLAAIKPFRMLDIDEDARILAEKIVSGKGVPGEYPEDALHIAIAAINGIDAVVTWNFAHLSNPFTRMMVRQIIQNEGYVCPDLYSADPNNLGAYRRYASPQMPNRPRYEAQRNDLCRATQMQYIPGHRNPN
jgi:predicted nucleic acid-binding protein